MLDKIDEIKLILKRADEHLRWLRQRIRHPNPDLVPADKGRYIGEASYDFWVAAEIRIHVGEFAGTLRNALNYLTCAFAEQDSGRIGKQVKFPIVGSPNEFAGLRASYLEGIADEHLALFEGLQPYKAGDWIKDLQTFSNWYRHTGLIKVHKVFQQHKSIPSPAQTKDIIMQMEGGVFPAVALEDGRPIIETLEKLLLRVREAIDQFEPSLSDYRQSFDH